MGLAEDTEAYYQRRRDNTLRHIATRPPTREALTGLLTKMRSLRDTYRKDGALHTAECIDAIDIPLIQDAVRRARS
jgi:formate dehydrogenase assembly factor FdhD